MKKLKKQSKHEAKPFDSWQRVPIILRNAMNGERMEDDDHLVLGEALNADPDRYMAELSAAAADEGEESRGQTDTVPPPSEAEDLLASEIALRSA